MNKNLAATGPYLSTESGPHVQSFFIALDHKGLDILDRLWRCPIKSEYIVHWILINEVVCAPIYYFIYFNRKFLELFRI